MKGLRFLKGAAVGLAMFGTALPQLTAAQPVVKTTTASKVTDVTLTSGGVLKGAVVNAQGTVIAGASVSIRQGDAEVAKVVTGKDGVFRVSGLKSGVYTVSGPQTSGVVRMWNEETAPPAARDAIVMVSSKTVVRGQDTGDLLTYAALGLGTAGLVTGIVALNDDDDSGSGKTPLVPASP